MIYLDYAAATPLDPQVAEAMLPFEREIFGNPSSVHGYGQKSRQAIDKARTLCMELLGAQSPKEIIFTGGGTESCNAAIFGAAFANQDKGKHIVISAFEHPAVLEAARYLRDCFGFELTEVQADENGIVQAVDVQNALRQETILVSVMLVNNEIGTIQPVQEIARLCNEHKIIFHTDACQAPGFTEIRVDHLGVDLMTLNGSKIYGPKGSGLLFVKKGTAISPFIFGGGQEFRMRGGTENTPAIVGFAKALELVLENTEEEKNRIVRLRDQLLGALLKFPNITLNGSGDQRVANNINIRVAGKSGETMVMQLDMAGVAASGGSACSSGKTEPTENLRLTLGKPTTEEEIKAAQKILEAVIGGS